MNRVLLVNDCKLENFIMRDMLINLGYEVIISNEFNAVREAQDGKFNVIIANFLMKEKTGDKLLQQIKNMHPETKCILSSSNEIKLEDLKKESIEVFVRTPVSKEKLKRVMQQIGETISKQEMSMNTFFCKYCGKKIEDDNTEIKFCQYCGKNISNK